MVLSLSVKKRQNVQKDVWHIQAWATASLQARSSSEAQVQEHCCQTVAGRERDHAVCQ